MKVTDTFTLIHSDYFSDRSKTSLAEEKSPLLRLTSAKSGIASRQNPAESETVASPRLERGFPQLWCPANEKKMATLSGELNQFEL